MPSSHRIVNAIRAPRPSLSFEFFPPRDPGGLDALKRHLDGLEAAVSPDFVSVTHGAGGSGPDRRESSARLARLVAQVGGPAAMRHLTVAGYTRAELVAIIEGLNGEEVDAVLALRGDPPGGPTVPWRPQSGGLDYAAQLVRLVSDAGHDAGVAAFPEGHPASKDLDQDLAVLRLKEEAGAAFAITQMVFGVEPYRRFVARVQAGGIQLPIVPGIMPVTAAAQLARLEVFAGAPLPAGLVGRLADAGAEVTAQREVGIEWAAELADGLLAAGAPGIHFYTLNRTGSSLEVCRRIGLRGRRLG